jgi:hypothetical protein
VNFFNINCIYDISGATLASPPCLQKYLRKTDVNACSIQLEPSIHLKISHISENFHSKTASPSAPDTPHNIWVTYSKISYWYYNQNMNKMLLIMPHLLIEVNGTTVNDLHVYTKGVWDRIFDDPL